MSFSPVSWASKPGGTGLTPLLSLILQYLQALLVELASFFVVAGVLGQRAQVMQ